MLYLFDRSEYYEFIIRVNTNAIDVLYTWEFLDVIIDFPCARDFH